MKNITLLMLTLLILSACTTPTEVDNQTPGKQYPPGAVVCSPESREGDICTMEYMPVCGNNDQTYGNKCQACHDETVQYYLPGECAEYNGGEQARVAFTQCSDPRPQACTKEYVPVCGESDNGIRCITQPCPSTNNRTYGNGCEACADATVYGYWPGACGDMPSDTGQPTKTFQDCAAQGNPIMESMPRKCTYPDKTVVVEMYTLCDEEGCEEVEKCPPENDVYGSQIGPACVNHYTADEMASWTVCETAKECANGYCAYTPRTTDGSPSKDNKLHCIPIDYYAFLLHTSGASGVNDDGEEYSVIA